MCARFQSSHVQTPADRQSRAHPPRPIHARDGSLPQAQLLHRFTSPNRRRRRLPSARAKRHWSVASSAGRPPVCPNPRRLLLGRRDHARHCFYSLSHTAPRPFLRLPHLTEQTQRTPPPPFLARELLSDETSRHHPPPPDPPHPEHHLDVAKRPELLPGEPDAAPSLATSSSSTPTTPTAERLLPDVHVDEPSLRKPPHLPLLFPRSYD